MNDYQKAFNEYWLRELECEDKLQTKRLKKMDIDFECKINRENISMLEEKINTNNSILDKINNAKNELAWAEYLWAEEIKKNLIASPILGLLILFLTIILRSPIQTQIIAFAITSLVTIITSCGIDTICAYLRMKPFQEIIKTYDEEKIKSENVSLETTLTKEKKKYHQNGKKLEEIKQEISLLEELLNHLMSCRHLIEKALKQARKKLKGDESPERNYNRRFKYDEKILAVLKLERQRKKKGK